MPAPKLVARTLAIQAFLLVATITAIDLLAYLALPALVAEELPDYRGRRETSLLGRGYPKDYYTTHADRGFDIKPTDKPRTDHWHELDEFSYRIWSNELGCFDRPRRGSMPAYVYFAGDSLTWGYAPSDTKFGTVYEQLTGTEVLKCGVSHTGQRHQFSKFVEIGQKLGRWPDKVVVFYSATDVANDYAHPHSTVVNGQLADEVGLDETNAVVRLDAASIDRAFVQNHNGIGKTLLRYSLTAHVVGGTLRALGIAGSRHWADRYVMHGGTKLYDLHRLTYLQTRGGVLQYETFKYADANKAVIREWSVHAKRFGYQLQFVLLPAGDALFPKRDASFAGFFKEFTLFLDTLGIKHHDLWRELGARNVDWRSIYWEDNAHFSDEGNILVGEILAEVL